MDDTPLDGTQLDDTQLDDTELIDRAKRGDVDAYAELVRRYQRDARRAAAAIGGAGLADDAAQEAFVRAFGFLHRFRPGAPFRPWLLAIVANVARNQRRSAGRWTACNPASGSSASLPASHRRRRMYGAGRKQQRGVRAAVGALPLRYRDVVACRYLLDLTEDETARVLGIARGTVKSRLSPHLDRLERQVESEVPRA